MDSVLTKMKYVCFDLVIALLVFLSVSAGFHKEYAEGCYYMFWTLLALYMHSWDMAYETQTEEEE